MVLSARYLALATAIMVWYRLVVTPDYLLFLLVPVALLSGTIGRWVADWVPFVALQDLIDHGRLGSAVNQVATVVYLSHFPAILGLGMMPWLVDRHVFIAHSTALLVLCLGAFMIYLVLPTAPPGTPASTG